jgi:hypothetical protein
MQWLKQTFAVRYNLLNGWSGHIWGDRYWSMIVEGEPPERMESLSCGAADAETLGGWSPLSWRVRARIRPLSGKTRTGVRPLPWEPAKIPRKAAVPPACPRSNPPDGGKNASKLLSAAPPANGCGRGLPSLSGLTRLD